MHHNINLQGAIDHIFVRLKKELNPNLYYHSRGHTKDVHRACRRLLLTENISSLEKILIETAACYHDSGMLITYNDHEEASVRIINEVLPGYGYGPEHIEMIAKMIMCTKLPQIACGLNGKILCDADMDYLGRSDFFMIAHRLRCEWEKMSTPYGLLDWYEFQLDFLLKHHYYTKSAQNLREEGKQKNVAEIKRLLGKY
ncbi:MAG: HD domain-containing protein [Bacteroidales bacterium]|nr:HD domain-containing protein [Bacteroidales bacterium]MDZ4205578.1 HD domain-containing protein [Bacteroidales bacterium]